MDKHDLNDEFDRQLRQMFNDAALDDAAVSEIADSPNIWRQVRQNIDRQSQAVRSPWPPVNTILRWLVPAVSAAAVLALVFALTYVKTPDQPQPVASTVRPSVNEIEAAKPTVPQPTQETAPIVAEKKGHSGVIVAKQTVPARRVTQRTSLVAKAVPVKKPVVTNEVKTDFIALSYARDPDSGQIVRVRVPISMMVSLGLVTSVKQPADLVDAEVLVGDDGLTRAIRFIR
jgi:hypothetical protein